MSLTGCALTLALALVSARDGGPGRAAQRGRQDQHAVRTAQRNGGKVAAPAPASKRTKRAPAAPVAAAAEKQLPPPPPAAATRAEPATATAEGGDATPRDDVPSGGKSAKTKVYTFGAMDVEGKLKTPQLLYFLNRVKLELEMSAPDHRSFIKELEKSADDPNL
jgi:hypothetical protein